MYSFFASCKEHDVNPRDWLQDVLLRIGNHKVNRLEELLPGHWAKSRGLDL
jgi:transposase